MCIIISIPQPNGTDKSHVEECFFLRDIKSNTILNHVINCLQADAYHIFYIKIREALASLDPICGLINQAIGDIVIVVSLEHICSPNNR